MWWKPQKKFLYECNTNCNVLAKCNEKNKVKFNKLFPRLFGISFVTDSTTAYTYSYNRPNKEGK